MRCELSTNSHEPSQHKWRRSSDTGGSDEQRMPSGVATARGGRLDGGSSRLDLAAGRTSLMKPHRLNFLVPPCKLTPKPHSTGRNSLL